MSNRDETIHVYLDEEEKKKIKEKAEEHGISASSYLRMKGLGKID